MRRKKCKACGEMFIPDRPMQKTCPKYECAITVGRQISKQAERRADRAKRLAIKTMSQLKAEAQKEFNAYIRLRDADRPCISCGRHHLGQWHAGHYLTTAAHPELRYDPRNCHKQCAPCNNHLSGNIVAYRQGLVARYGSPLVEWLEGPHQPKRYTRDDLIAEAAKWRKLARMLRDANDSMEAAREINFELP